MASVRKPSAGVSASPGFLLLQVGGQILVLFLAGRMVGSKYPPRGLSTTIWPWAMVRDCWDSTWNPLLEDSFSDMRVDEFMKMQHYLI